MKFFKKIKACFSSHKHETLNTSRRDENFKLRHQDDDKDNCWDQFKSFFDCSFSPECNQPGGPRGPRLC